MEQVTNKDIYVHLFFNNLPLQKNEFFVRNEAIIVQHMNYKCEKFRDDCGRPYGGTKQTILKFTIIVSSKNKLSTVYELIKENENRTLNFIFAPVYRENELNFQVVQSCNRIISFTGYVVGLNEIYGSSNRFDNADTHSNVGYELKNLREDVRNIERELDKKERQSAFSLKEIYSKEPLMTLEVSFLVDSIEYVDGEYGNSNKLFINY